MYILLIRKKQFFSYSIAKTNYFWWCDDLSI